MTNNIKNELFKDFLSNERFLMLSNNIKILIYYIFFIILLFYIIYLFIIKKTHSGNILKYINHTLYSYDIKILNFGSGDGLLSNEIFNMGFKNIYNCDIKDLSIDKTIPTIVYDGKTIPFNNNYFDIVIVNFVLHHINTESHYNILKEIKRVSKNLIIISEDNIEKKIDNFLGSLHILITNKWNSHHNAYFKTPLEFKTLFKNLDLNIKEIIDIPRNYSLIYPIKRIIFILEKY
jgi:2-polyprenyl-3-methyl-5-hydroxy-6-metoxy-1,4-benzoquinol methylase